MRYAPVAYVACVRLFLQMGQLVHFQVLEGEVTLITLVACILFHSLMRPSQVILQIGRTDELFVA